MTGRSDLLSLTRLIPLGAFLLAAIAGCQDHDLPTALGPDGPVFSLLPSAPVVNSLLDPGDGTCDAVGTGDGCTLREAIAFAENDAVITFDPTLTGTITLNGTDLLIEKALTITGPGVNDLAVSGNDESRVFTIRDVSVSISGLHIHSGKATEGGGIAIYGSTGSLTLRDSGVGASFATTAGGGIYVSGAQLILRNSTINGNQVTGEWGEGGGIALLSGQVSVEGSTLARNRADRGGGVSNRSGTLTVTTSTISYNDADDDGGGVYSDAGSGLTSILNSTISNNTVGYNGGGLYNHDGLTQISHSTITGNNVSKTEAEGGVGGGIMSGPAWESATGSRIDVKGSIIWGNTLAGTPDDVAAGDGQQPYWSDGYNLIGAAGLNVSFDDEFKATGDQTGVDAKLGGLADNGGPTLTHALLAGSPAIDAGTCADHNDETVTTDQRGVSRPQGSACDIGAFELQEVTGPVFYSACTFTVNLRNGQHQVTVTWENAVPGVTLIQVTDGRTVSRQMNPTESGSWSTRVKDPPTYAMWGGKNRKDTSKELVAPGGQCMQEMQK